MNTLTKEERREIVMYWPEKVLAIIDAQATGLKQAHLTIAELREELDTSTEPSGDLQESQAIRTLRAQRDAQTRRLRAARAVIAKVREWREHEGSRMPDCVKDTFDEALGDLL